MKNFNSSFIILTWRLVDPLDTSLWKQLLTKYTRNLDYWDSIARPYASTLWKNLVEIKKLTRDNTLTIIGNVVIQISRLLSGYPLLNTFCILFQQPIYCRAMWSTLPTIMVIGTLTSSTKSSSLS